MKINEKGRSMIEMLGVLAIIGVLSVGGIAGYSKAMAKFRANKTIDLVSHIVANTRILFGSQINYADIDGGENGTNQAQLIVRSKLFPDETISVSNDNGNVTTGFTNAYAGGIGIRASGRFSATDNKAFVITLSGIPQDACIDLASQDWNASSGSGFVALIVGPGTTEQPKQGGNPGEMVTVDSNYDGNMDAALLVDCTQGGGSGYSIACGNSGKPMSVIDATLGCTSRNNNMMLFKFY